MSRVEQKQAREPAWESIAYVEYSGWLHAKREENNEGKEGARGTLNGQGLEDKGKTRIDSQVSGDNGKWERKRIKEKGTEDEGGVRGVQTNNVEEGVRETRGDV
jgi:hypothetical protein